MRNKINLTNDIISKLPDGHQWTVNDALLLWWYNIRANGGMRLTKVGYEMFCEYSDSKPHKLSYDTKKAGHSRMMISLDNKLNCPYYINQRRAIIMFGDKEAMLAMLYSDLEQFIKHYS